MLKNPALPFRIIKSMLRARKVIREVQPQVVIGVGGYASGPTLWVANRKGIPTVLQEQNSYPGVTNKMLAKHANKIYVAYDGMDRWFDKEKLVKAGNPVRQMIVKGDYDKSRAAHEFGFDPRKQVVLVVGGSLGSRTINRSIANGLKKLIHLDVQIIWQTGKLYYQEYGNLEQEYENLKVVPFIKEMDKAYAAADVIISRAGAIVVSELQVLGKPVILVPLPNVVEDHQAKNAKALEDKNAALMIRDEEAPQELVEELLKLLENGGQRERMSANIRKMAITDAAERIARDILDMVKGKYNGKVQSLKTNAKSY
jgi:UDP-N-acetylglucosamine--N-acetylmuramyl-(pentapeptide) pyrophosphoryl-undecaprenol N-acetylglucosamine transferase